MLFTSTGLTRYLASPSYSVYAAMKGAIEVYTRYAAKARVRDRRVDHRPAD